MERNGDKRTVVTTVAACVVAAIVFYGVISVAHRQNWLELSLQQITWGNFGIQFAIHGLALLLPPVVCLLVTRTKPSAAGLNGKNKWISLGLGMIYLLLFFIAGDFSVGGIYYWLHILLNIGLAEELMYRGFAYSRLKQVNPWLALLVSGFFWGAGHAIYAGVIAGRSIPQILAAMVVGGGEISVTALGGMVGGIGFAALYEWSGTLFVPVLVHAILDFSGHQPETGWIGLAVTAAVVVFLGVKKTRVEHESLAFWSGQTDASKTQR